MSRARNPAVRSPADGERAVTTQAPSGAAREARRADAVVERMEWALIEAAAQLRKFRAIDGNPAGATPSRSVRRSTARRASRGYRMT
jgi:hypothetical protein